MHTCVVHVYVHACIRTCVVHVYVHACIRTCVVHVYVHACIRTCVVHVYVHACIVIYVCVLRSEKDASTWSKEKLKSLLVGLVVNGEEGKYLVLVW